MNKSLLNTGVQDFIKNNFKADILSIALKSSPFDGVTPQELAQQVAGRKKTLEKLPSWHRANAIYYPPGLNLEQASSEATARYKASLISGNWLVDLTGGFGVDAYFFARQSQRVDYFEIDTGLAEIAAHNFRQLGATNIRVHPGDGLDYLRGLQPGSSLPDWIYADPSRRHAKKGRVIRLEDYAPDIPGNLDLLLGVSDNLLVKTSPMLDLSAGLKALRQVAEIHVVAVKNEVKELLWVIRSTASDGPRIHSSDLSDGHPPFRFHPDEEASASSQLALPARYLYEPGAALLKAGAFKLAGTRYGLGKLHRHTHLYTSEKLIPYPGRRFRILETHPYKPGRLPYREGHVNSRNFPEDVARIRKRNRIKSGGNTYLFFVRAADDALRVLAAEAV